MDKEILGVIEKVKVINPLNKKSATLYALIDTGATLSSLDVRIASKLNLSLTKYKIIKAKTLLGDKIIRPTVKAIVEIHKKRIECNQITIADRSNLSVPMIVGRDVLYGNFIVDVSKKHKSNKIEDLTENINLKEVEYEV